jgi:hypothetical protein
LKPQRDDAPADQTGDTVQMISAAQQDRPQNTAELRASALALDTAAVAEGIWPASAEILDALAHLAGAVVWDLAVA